MAHEQRPVLDDNAPAIDSRHRILVVEDDSGTRELIKLALNRHNVQLVNTVDGLSGWEKTLELVPDLVILDLALPKMNGWTFLQKMRIHTTVRTIPVLVITAHGQSGMATDVRHVGADGFLEKPFRPVELRKAVDQLLQ